MLNNTDSAKLLNEIISRVSKNVVEHTLSSSYVYCRRPVIIKNVSTDNSSATISFPFSPDIESNVKYKNRSGTNLISGQKAYLMFPYGKLDQGWIETNKSFSSKYTTSSSGGGSVNDYTLPPATTASLGGIIVGEGLIIQGNGLLSVDPSILGDLKDAETLGGHPPEYFATNQDLTLKQDKIDNNLQTTSKTIVGSINEINDNLQQISLATNDDILNIFNEDNNTTTYNTDALTSLINLSLLSLFYSQLKNKFVDNDTYNNFQQSTNNELQNFNSELKLLQNNLSNNYYDKDDVDVGLNNINQNLMTNYYSKTQSNNLFATKEQLNNKVDKVEGKQLSTNDYTNTDKNNLNNVTKAIPPGGLMNQVLRKKSNQSYDTEWAYESSTPSTGGGLNISFDPNTKSIIFTYQAKELIVSFDDLLKSIIFTSTSQVTYIEFDEEEKSILFKTNSSGLMIKFDEETKGIVLYYS